MWISGVIRSGSFSSRKADSRRSIEPRSFWRRRSTPAMSRTWRRVSASSLAKRLLGDIVGRPGAEGLDGDVLAAVRRHQDHGQAGVFLADALDQGQAIHAGHLEVGQDDGR